MKEKSYKNCQSCGMPLKKDAKGGAQKKMVPKALCIVAFVMPMVPLWVGM